MTKDEALKLCDYLECNDASMEAQRKAAAFIRKTLAQPEQGPECVAVINVLGNDWKLEQLSLPVGKHRLYAQQYTYTTLPKREWVGLTDDELMHIGVATGLESAAAQMIESKLKDKNL